MTSQDYQIQQRAAPLLSVAVNIELKENVSLHSHADLRQGDLLCTNCG